MTPGGKKGGGLCEEGRFDEEAGPSFEEVGLGAEGGEVEEGEVGKGGFARADFVGGEFDEVDDAEVDLADIVGVIIEQGEESGGVGAGEVNFLGQLAFDGPLIHGEIDRAMEAVVFVDMPSDADGGFGHEAFFAGAAATEVAEDAALVAEDAVGDDLFEAGVVFRQRAG